VQKKGERFKPRGESLLNTSPLRVPEKGEPHSLSIPVNIVQKNISKFKMDKKNILHIISDGC